MFADWLLLMPVRCVGLRVGTRRAQKQKQEQLAIWRLARSNAVCALLVAGNDLSFIDLGFERFFVFVLFLARKR